MNDEDLGRALEASAARRVRSLRPRPDVEELFARLDARATRQRRILTATVGVVLVVGVAAGIAIGRAEETSTTPSAVIARDDGTPPPEPAARPQIEPADVDGARVAIAAAFHDAFGGGVSDAARDAATQDGKNLRTLVEQAKALAAQFGYTPAQLAGTTISLRDVAFIDESHAVVHFTLSIPEHGTIHADRVGYAVHTDGRWKVALRTACDLLSLGGLGRTCPPAP